MSCLRPTFWWSAPPLYNYAMPSTLKAWIDHIHVPGVTASFDVPCRPLTGRPAVIVTTRGGIYDAGSANAGRDHAVPPLHLILEQELGMEVSVVVVGRTLAGRLPALADEAARADLELVAAHADAARLGGTV